MLGYIFISGYIFILGYIFIRSLLKVLYKLFKGTNKIEKAIV